MRVLLDSCVSPKAGLALTRDGHETDWVGSWNSDPGDLALVEFAVRDGWVIATIDKDFGDLIHLGQSQPCSVIRLVGFRVASQGPALADIVGRYHEELAKGALITAEPWRIRVRSYGGLGTS